MNYLTIQKWTNDNRWQGISADEYISLKNTYLGVGQFEKNIIDYLLNKLDFFDNDGNTRPFTQNELDEFFNEWSKSE